RLILIGVPRFPNLAQSIGEGAPDCVDGFDVPPSAEGQRLQNPRRLHDAVDADGTRRRIIEAEAAVAVGNRIVGRSREIELMALGWEMVPREVEAERFFDARPY